MARRYDAVLFDFDGVLVDSEPVHFECWREIVAGYGINLDWPTYCEQGIGIADRLMLRFLCNQVDPPLAVDRLIAEYPRKKQMFLDRMLRDPRITPEVRCLVEELSSAYKLAVVTSSGRTEVEPLLKAAGLLQYFHAGVYSQDVTRKKPEPDPYLLAVERLNASNALVVEDSDAGEASGRAAGLDVLRIRTTEEMVPRVRASLGL